MLNINPLFFGYYGYGPEKSPSPRVTEGGTHLDFTGRLPGNHFT